MYRIRITSIGLLLNVVLLLGDQGLLSPVTAALDSDTNCIENGTRAHLTRCDKYFQCLLLPSQRVIWVSKQCDEGLIYDQDHGKCVLPNLDWECNLGDDGALMGDPDHPAPDHVKDHDQENVYGVDNFEDDYIGRSDESSGGEEVTDASVEGNSLQSSVEEEFSGDGTAATTEVEPDDISTSSTEAVSMEMPITPDRDGTVKSYLQRLTQLIDGFRRNGASDTDITPDQLNSFVIMHKIKNGNHLRPTGTELLPENGKILKPHLDYILQKQNSLNTVNSPSADPPKPPVRRRIIHIIRPYHRPEPDGNTNIVVKSQMGNGSDNQTGLSNSQIVVNRPEGSVLFNIARPASSYEDGRPQTNHDPIEPSISKDTLKSILELSKQLVSHQKYLVEKPNYLPPVVQPVYYSFPVPMVQSPSKAPNTLQGESVNNSMVSQFINAPQSTPVKLQPAKYPESVHPSKYNDGGYMGNYYQNPKPQPFRHHNKYSSSSSSHEQGMDNYVPLRPMSLYEGAGSQSDYSGQSLENYNKMNSNYNNPIHNSNKNKYQNDFSNNQNSYQNTKYNSGYYSSSHPHPSQYYNPNQQVYNTHQPPYYDGTGMGQSNSNYYTNTNYPNQQFNQMDQYSQTAANYYPHNPMVPLSSSSSNNHHHHHSHHQTSSAEQNDEFDSVETNDSANESEELSSSWEMNSKPVKMHSEESTESKPTESPLSSLQLLSQQLMMDSSAETNGGNMNKIVGINGNYMSYDTYRETIMPLLNADIQGQSNLEVIACTAGIRHQNSSDCTRYYVCNPKTGNLLGYTCPPFTAFNEMTRICDAGSYALCKPSLISTRFTIAENKRLQYEAQKALQDAKRIREQAVQAQKMAEFIRQKAEEEQSLREKPEFLDTPEEKPIRHRITQKEKRPSQHFNRIPSSSSSAGAHRPTLLSSLGNKKRKRYKCMDVGQAIPDVENNNKYFMCFRDSEGRFKRRSMSCAKGLVFCRAKRMCTLKPRC